MTLGVLAVYPDAAGPTVLLVKNPRRPHQPRPGGRISNSHSEEGRVKREEEAMHAIDGATNPARAALATLSVAVSVLAPLADDFTNPFRASEDLMGRLSSEG